MVMRKQISTRSLLAVHMQKVWSILLVRSGLSRSSRSNYTQILRKKFSFPRTALKPGTDFDKDGIYKDKAKETSLRHLMDLEKAFLFGVKSAFVTTIDGDDTIERTTGGVLYWLRQYEAAFSSFGVEMAWQLDLRQ